MEFRCRVLAHELARPPPWDHDFWDEFDQFLPHSDAVERPTGSGKSRSNSLDVTYFTGNLLGGAVARHHSTPSSDPTDRLLPM